MGAHASIRKSAVCGTVLCPDLFVHHGFPRSTGPATGNQVVGEPITGEHRNLFERVGFFEQMSGTGNHGERALASDCGLRPSVQFQRHFIASPDDQQRRCVDFGQRPTGEVGPPPRETTAAMFARGSAAATRAAPVPVLAPK